MPPQQSQSNLDPNQVSVGLAQTNHFLSQHLQSQLPPAQDPNQGLPTDQTNQADVTEQITGLETRLMDELTTLKKEMKDQGDGKKELTDLKTQIEQILNSSD